MKPYFKKNKITLYKDNSFEVMDFFKKKNTKFDMIFADPPYFLSNDGITCINGKMVKVNKGKWDRSKGVEQNYQFTHDWMSRCKDLLKDDGTLWVSGTFHIIYSVAFAAQKLQMKFLNNITWEKPNPPPNLSCRFFTHSTETVLWFGKEKKSKHKFNYKLMRELNNNKQMKDVWRFTAPKKNEKSLLNRTCLSAKLILELLCGYRFKLSKGIRSCLHARNKGEVFPDDGDGKLVTA